MAAPCHITRNTAKERKMIVLGDISFDPVFTKAMVQGKTVFEYDPEAVVCVEIKNIWKNILNIMGNNKIKI